MKRQKTMQYRHRLRPLVLFSLLGLLGVQHPASAEAPAELQGKWSSQPGRCEPISGEVDVLTITAAELGFYEIGCNLGRATRSGANLRFDAQCYKGGSPVTPGEVVLRRHAPNEIDLMLKGFSWIAAKPQRYHRC
jgi:hypothetical protein